MNNLGNSQALSVDDYLEATFEDWAYALQGIYGYRNSLRSPSEMWLRAVSDASKVGEAVRKTDAFEAMLYITHTFGWIITTCTKLLETEYRELPALQKSNGLPQESLTDIIVSKYPGICPYCGKDICHCPSIRRTVERETKSERRERLNKVKALATETGALPLRVADVAAMFEDIYGQVHYSVSLGDIAFHFLEEIGEVASCITRLEDGSKRHADSVSLSVQLSEEIADVVGWGFAVMGKLSNLAKESGRLAQAFDGHHGPAHTLSLNWETRYILPRYLWREFYDLKTSRFLCNHCKSAACEC